MDPRLVRAGSLVLLLALLVQDQGAAHPARPGQKYKPLIRRSEEDSQALGQEGDVAARAADEEDAAGPGDALRQPAFKMLLASREKRIQPEGSCFGQKIDRIGHVSGMGCNKFDPNKESSSTGKK
ncbi:natriuretic peptide GNP1 isoform X2 [Varanus komodoensis]|uniref:Natriuretic peptide toxin Var2 n=1 Tax=Varanus komodoensis TaxID=61221 RepID=B6CJV0_VARKO|nr:natriuretic peptide GNP1 isoform X2 [Varanus komodoensis]ABY89670.1 natriuretic peptide toxin Var2 [Varanus komodoensis]